MMISVYPLLYRLFPMTECSVCFRWDVKERGRQKRCHGTQERCMLSYMRCPLKTEYSCLNSVKHSTLCPCRKTGAHIKSQPTVGQPPKFNRGMKTTWQHLSCLRPSGTKWNRYDLYSVRYIGYHHSTVSTWFFSKQQESMKLKEWPKSTFCLSKMIINYKGTLKSWNTVHVIQTTK